VLRKGKGVLAHRLMARYVPFWDAAYQGDLPRMREMIDNDPAVVNRHPPTWKSVYQPTALAYAVWGNQPSAVRLLLENGADPNLADGDHNYHPLHWTSYKSDHAECAQFLVNAGADVAVKTARGFTPLQMATGLNDVVSPKPGVAAVLEEAAMNPRPAWRSRNSATMTPALPTNARTAAPPAQTQEPASPPRAVAWSPLEAAAAAAEAERLRRPSAESQETRSRRPSSEAHDARMRRASAEDYPAQMGTAAALDDTHQREAIRGTASAPELPLPRVMARLDAANPTRSASDAWDALIAPFPVASGSSDASSAAASSISAAASAKAPPPCASGSTGFAAATAATAAVVVTGAGISILAAAYEARESQRLDSLGSELFGMLLLLLGIAAQLGILLVRAPFLAGLRAGLVPAALQLLGHGPLQPQPAKLPPQFMCPITGEIMRDPVTTADGHTFERRAIERWLLTHGSSPMTGAPLPHKQLAPAIALRQLIDSHVSAGREAGGK